MEIQFRTSLLFSREFPVPGLVVYRVFLGKIRKGDEEIELITGCSKKVSNNHSTSQHLTLIISLICIISVFDFNVRERITYCLQFSFQYSRIVTILD